MQVMITMAGSKPLSSEGSSAALARSTKIDGAPECYP